MNYRNQAFKNRSRILSAIFGMVLIGFGTVSAQPAKKDSVIGEALDHVEKNVSERAILVDAVKPAAAASARTSRIDVLEVKNMDMKEVLDLIAFKSGLEIQTPDNLSGKVTIFLKNVKALDALRIILNTNNLAYVEEDGKVKVLTAEEYKTRMGRPFNEKQQSQTMRIIHSEPSDIIRALEQVRSETGKIIFEESTNALILMDTPEKVEALTALVKELDMPIETEVIDLKYARAQIIEPKVREMLTQRTGVVQSSESANALIITDTRPKIEKIKQLVQQWDKQQRNVRIETKIIQIILNDEHSTGLDWEAIVTDYQNMEFYGFAYNQELKDTGRLSIGTISKEDFEILLEALDTVGIISTVSNLDLKSTLGEESMVKVSSRDVYLTPDHEKDGRSEKEFNEDVRLFVTPKSFIENAILVNIRPWRDIDAEVEEDADNVRKDVNMQIENGGTIVIGGLFEDVTVESMRKIPLLGDIPFLGFAFRGSGQSTRKAEIIVFLTVQLIKEGETAKEQ